MTHTPERRPHVLHHSVVSLLRMLHAYVTQEATGQSKSANALAEEIGFAGDTGVALRRACVERGWLDVLEPPRGRLPGRVTVTAAGRAALEQGVGAVISGATLSHGSRRSPTPATPAAKGRAERVQHRRCLCCGRGFESEGPGNRICGSCRNTDAFQSSAADSFVLRVR